MFNILERKNRLSCKPQAIHTRKYIQSEFVIFYFDNVTLLQSIPSSRSVVYFFVALLSPFFCSCNFFFLFENMRRKARYAQYACWLQICCSPSMLLHHFFSVLCVFTFFYGFFYKFFWLEIGSIERKLYRSINHKWSGECCAMFKNHWVKICV